jgi:hypothetical protein
MILPLLSAGVSRKNTPSPAISDAVEPLRVRGPFGPIGLPGQDCSGACLHVCMLTGWNVEQCYQSCLSTCGGIPGGLLAFG